MFLFQLNVVVSGALDRLHSEKDPCVKYDVNRKIWIYLHRSRTEEEFGKITCNIWLGMFLDIRKHDAYTFFTMFKTVKTYQDK